MHAEVAGGRKGQESRQEGEVQLHLDPPRHSFHAELRNPEAADLARSTLRNLETFDRKVTEFLEQPELLNRIILLRRLQIIGVTAFKMLAAGLFFGLALEPPAVIWGDALISGEGFAVASLGMIVSTAFTLARFAMTDEEKMATRILATREEKCSKGAPSLSRTVILPQPESHEALVDMLAKYNMPVKEYGHGSAKSTESLWAKVRKGETKFGDFEGTLVRILPAVARAMITHTGENGLNVLIENDQGIYAEESASPLERANSGNYSLQTLIQRKSLWAVWETMREGEDKDSAMVRGLCEELVRYDPEHPGEIHPDELPVFNRYGITNREDLEGTLEKLIQYQGHSEDFEPPFEYPGLGTLYISHSYQLSMPPFLMRPGYAARDEEGKINLFGWMPADVCPDVIDAAMRRQLAM